MSDPIETARLALAALTEPYQSGDFSRGDALNVRDAITTIATALLERDAEVHNWKHHAEQRLIALRESEAETGRVRDRYRALRAALAELAEAHKKLAQRVRELADCYPDTEGLPEGPSEMRWGLLQLALEEGAVVEAKAREVLG